MAMRRTYVQAGLLLFAFAAIAGSAHADSITSPDSIESFCTAITATQEGPITPVPYEDNDATCKRELSCMSDKSGYNVTLCESREGRWIPEQDVKEIEIEDSSMCSGRTPFQWVQYDVTCIKFVQCNNATSGKSYVGCYNDDEPNFDMTFANIVWQGKQVPYLANPAVPRRSLLQASNEDAVAGVAPDIQPVLPNNRLSRKGVLGDEDYLD